jgi:hypothetical protein
MVVSLAKISLQGRHQLRGTRDAPEERMNKVRRALVVVVAALGRSWTLVRSALASGRRGATTTLVQVNTIRRRYALGAASREQFETAVRKHVPAVHPRRGSRTRRRKKAA